MINVSTKTGDAGETSLASGKRIAKSDIIFEVIGTIDELNSHLGLVKASFNDFTNNPELKKQQDFLKKTQKQLFILGGYVAEADIDLSSEFLTELEKKSIYLQEIMDEDWHARFVLPGGHLVAARLDIARSVCRRLERRCIDYIEERDLVDSLLLKTINRLSDYLYVLRCFVNEEVGVKEYYV